jgi:UDP-N-acetylglucosamine:LPS N-acetylglucosamine transferase
MCGNNRNLLESLKGRRDCHAIGFVNNVADYMRIADFFIGKPGPGSLSEAIHMGCPVIVERNASTLPQERANVEWVRDNGLGIVVRSFRKDIASAGERMLRDLDRYKANIEANIPENRAVFEVVDILGRIVSAGSSRKAGPTLIAL